jgi:hypothetical protein
MLATRRLEEVTGGAAMSWVEEDSVVWVSFHFFFVVFRCDNLLCHYTLVEQNIWQYNSTGDPKFMGARQPRPCSWDKYPFANHE